MYRPGEIVLSKVTGLKLFLLMQMQMDQIHLRFKLLPGYIFRELFILKCMFSTL